MWKNTAPFIKWLLRLEMIAFTLLAIGILCATLFPALFLNIGLSFLRRKATGAFDLSVSFVQYTVASLTLSGIVWKNAQFLGYKTPYFARVGVVTVVIDWLSVPRALLWPSTHPIIVRTVDVSNVTVFLEKTPPQGEQQQHQAPSINLWAAMGAANDGEATSAHVNAQQKIATAASGAGLDVTNLLGVVGEEVAKLATPDHVAGVVGDLLGLKKGEKIR